MWVRGLKLLSYEISRRSRRSHPMWVRGLKLPWCARHAQQVLSHPMWVRGLKRLAMLYTYLYRRRTLCGCVD